jgi:hypothetical protein
LHHDVPAARSKTLAAIAAAATPGHDGVAALAERARLAEIAAARDALAGAA